MIGTICKVCGFTLSEVRSLTCGQVVRFMRSIPELMPLSNAFAAHSDDKKKGLTGDAAIMALNALGVKDDRSKGGE